MTRIVWDIVSNFSIMHTNFFLGSMGEHDHRSWGELNVNIYKQVFVWAWKIKLQELLIPTDIITTKIITISFFIRNSTWQSWLICWKLIHLLVRLIISVKLLLTNVYCNISWYIVSLRKQKCSLLWSGLTMCR